ncbi:MAG TPA: PQQ-dependent sugar dehydrogenase [Thermomicrobiales bacterium]|nr:PQQ-dependent sugar dehydrogenase [Thermomicrobiales bacterium]
MLLRPGVLVVIVLALVLTACGSGGDDATATPAGTATPTQTPAPTRDVEIAPTPTVVESSRTEPVRLDRIQLALDEVGTGFDQPVFVTHAGDSSGRVFVLEKTGAIRLLDGALYLDISDRVLFYELLSNEHELGLLGLAFHPDFETNRYFFAHYIDKSQNHVISRFEEGPGGVADPASELIMFTYPQPDINFAGGMLAFGTDGFLYIGLGTATPDDPSQVVAQQLDNFYGKILRIAAGDFEPYGIPGDNPFVGVEGARPEVWAYGLRNPWRFSFDRQTNDLYIGGPGEFRKEWINFTAGGDAGGLNFGWPIIEGDECWEFSPLPCDLSGLELPIISYDTYGDGNCVVIGGFVYRGSQHPSLDGVYLYGDYCSGRIWGAGRDDDGVWQTRELLDTDLLITSFGEDEAGELYVTGGFNGAIYRVQAQ